MIEECSSVSDVIDFAISLHINYDLLWELLLDKTKGDNKKVNDLLEYIEFYNNPVSVISYSF